jgi:hypothetical protein
VREARVAKADGRMMALAAGAGLALVLAGQATAAPAKSGLNGMWTVDQDYFDRPKAPLPLTPEGQALREAKTKAIAAGDVIGEGGKTCAPHGMPSMMANEFALEFLETPGRVTIINEAATLVRTVYLNKKVHTDDVEPSYNGHSIGHWEGNTLVIDTVNFNDKGDVLGFIGVKSSTTHLVERYHVENGGKTLVGEFTFTDPRYLTRPATIRATYRRLPDDAELWEYACEIGGGWQERFKGDKDGVQAALK